MAATGPAAAIDKTFVDLYGEVCDYDQTVEASDLYDAVLTGSVSQKKEVAPKVTPTPKEPVAKEEDKAAAEPPITRNDNGGNGSKKHSVYIGNFSWWTSDKDLTNMAQTLGVKDIKEIKFAENRINGQSRGYAEIILSTEDSLWKLVEKVPRCKLNGVSVDCRIATPSNMKRFEAIANKCMPLRIVKDEREFAPADKVPVLLSQSSPQPVPPMYPQHLAGQPFPMPNPYYRHVAPPPSVPPPPFPPMMPYSSPPPTPQYMPPPQPPPVASQPPPSLHINPAFFPPGHGSHSSSDYSQQQDPAPSQDLEELMNRNRTIASSAITKAVTGAMTGDLRLAMETLLTAISVIKQSRVYSDERCQTLLTSLKDCLVSIQGNYNTRNSHPSQERERDPDRDRDRERDWDRERERERDWDRERDRERDWARGRERDRDSSEARRRRERSRSGEEDRDRMRDRERHTSRDHRDRYR